GCPWGFARHVDNRGDEQQSEGLADILVGRSGGAHVLELPWIRKPSELVDARSSRIEIGNGELRIGEAVRLRATRPVETGDDVRCIVPGYDVEGGKRGARAVV